MLCVVAKGIGDCLRLGPVPKLGGCGVCIQVLDCRGSEPSIGQREFYDPANSSPILRGSICVKGVTVRGVTHKLRKHFGSSAQSVISLFKNKHARPFAKNKSIPVTVPGARSRLRVLVP